jgi:hypothetical protein
MRHQHIEDHQRGTMRMHLVQCGRAVGDGEHVKARAFEERRERIRNGRVVIGEQNEGAVVFHFLHGHNAIQPRKVPLQVETLHRNVSTCNSAY